jgi:RimJ/RimL family protein N-acetyltransferase
MFRQATLPDLPALLNLFAEARQFMAASGNPDQWADGYPSPALLRSDIEAGRSYVLEEQREILVSFYFAPGPDRTYQTIDGAWHTDGPYHVIHRIASATHGKGAAARCVSWCKEQAPVLRIDTHHDNRVMQRFLQKQGFSPCGVIHLDNGEPRLAFDWQGETAVTP